MPCNSDYLEPNARERELQRAAQLLAYVLAKSGQPIKDKDLNELLSAGANIYCRDDRWLIRLCDTLRAMPEAERDQFIYGDARDKKARDLADWWEQHQKADADREAKVIAVRIKTTVGNASDVVRTIKGFLTTQKTNGHIEGFEVTE